MPNIAETPVPKDLSELVDVLSEEMGPHGLDTLADVDRIQQIMANYESNASDWNQYALFDEGRYTRNLVSAGNGKFNLMVSV
jgi:cysteine dioxygenase